VHTPWGHMPAIQLQQHTGEWQYTWHSKQQAAAAAHLAMHECLAGKHVTAVRVGDSRVAKVPSSPTTWSARRAGRRSSRCWKKL
jgi:hypothetical protein